MRRKSSLLALCLVALGFVIALVAGSGRAGAHCDAPEGAMAQAAKRALVTGDLSHVEMWVSAEQTQELRHTFNASLTLRKMGGLWRDASDRWFLENLSRLHHQRDHHDAADHTH
jgi:hypothetical protein